MAATYRTLLAGCAPTPPASGFLLDDFPADMAFSTRQLRTGQQYALRIRRDSDNTEQDFGFVDAPPLVGKWVDSNAIAAFCAGTVGRVSVLYDQSGNGRDYVQTTAAAQPIIFSGGVLRTIQNSGTGSPALRFENDTWLLLRDVDTFAYPTGSIYAAIFGVVNADDTGADSVGCIYQISSTATQRMRLVLKVTNATNRTIQFQASNIGNLGGTAVPSVNLASSSADQLRGKSQFAVNFQMSTTAQSVVFKDNAQIITGTGVNGASTFNTDTIKRSAIGGNAWNPAAGGETESFCGTIGELIFYNNDKAANISTLSINQLAAWV